MIDLQTLQGLDQRVLHICIIIDVSGVSMMMDESGGGQEETIHISALSKGLKRPNLEFTNICPNVRSMALEFIFSLGHFFNQFR